MDKKPIIDFLQYLHKKAERVAKQEVINKHDLIDLMMDIQKLRTETTDLLDIGLKNAIMNLNINARISRLYGGWHNFFFGGIGWGPFHREQLRQESGTKEAAKSILDFRNQVSLLLFRIEQGLPLQ